MTRVAILRCGKLPSFVNWQVPNLDELFEEDNLLLHRFKAQGFQARPIVWNRPNIDWNQFDIALIRSTWDYLDEQERFLHVLSQIEASSCRLFNPLAAVRWNIDKRYLFDLEKWGCQSLQLIWRRMWSFSYFNRQLGHVLLKKPAPNDYRVQGIYGGTVQSVEPLSHDLLQAEAVIAKLPFDILYARLDFVRVGSHLSVIEIELIEPIFCFNLVPESVVRLVNAIRVKFEMHP